MTDVRAEATSSYLSGSQVKGTVASVNGMIKKCIAGYQRQSCLGGVLSLRERREESREGGGNRSGRRT